MGPVPGAGVGGGGEQDRLLRDDDVEKADDSLPLHINITHLLPCDAEVVQDHVLCVPDDTTQEKPVEKNGLSPHGFPTKRTAVLD